jgi:AAA domain, putative AbiEii toxin, Type IV TA system
MIKRLQLQHFKGFERFDIAFKDDNWLVGPNNAGKSTIIAALRTAAQMASFAQRRVPEHFPTDRGVEVPSHWYTPGRYGLVEENLRHEFRDVETRLEVTFSSRARLTAVWPRPSGEEEAYFYLRASDGVYVRTTAEARALLPDVGVVPILEPVQHREKRLADEYVNSSMGTRLASRHTRNQIRLLRDKEPDTEGYDNLLSEFRDWARPWTRDFRVGDLAEHLTDEGAMLDLYCRETGGRSDRELFWAGDGLQVWIQLLMHLFRNQGRDAVILDEPDLYLHADLQRRLVRLLESMDTQTIAASHSAEVLVEAPPSSVVWISRERRQAVRAPSEKVASELTVAIGSQFNLRLARALRARAVLFVEGEDMRILRNVAATLSATKLANEVGIVTVPLHGFTNWEHVEPFSWLLDELLDQAVTAMVILDRDYHTDTQIVDIEGRLRDVRVIPHVWKRKELESYLLVPSAMARCSCADESDIRGELGRLATASKEKIFARILAERHETEVTAGRHRVNITENARVDFEQLWTDTAIRPHLCNAKELLADTNRWLQGAGFKTLSARTLSSALRRTEITDEMAGIIQQAEGLIT